MALVRIGDRSDIYDLQINCISFNRFYQTDLANFINMLSDEALAVDDCVHWKNDEGTFTKV